MLLCEAEWLVVGWEIFYEVCCFKNLFYVGEWEEGLGGNGGGVLIL